MTAYEFVENLWLNASAPEYREPIDIETATDDLNRFRAYAEHDDAIIIPDDITPELFVEIWNELVNTVERDS